jgi:glycosyltransferase involved in cell wall biosynthesis
MGFLETIASIPMTNREYRALTSWILLANAREIGDLAARLNDACRPSVVHASFSFPSQIQLAKYLRVPLVYSMNNYRVASGNVPIKQKLFMRYFLNYVDHIDSLYPYSKTTYLRFRKKITVNYFPPIEIPDSHFKKEDRILFAARLINEKGALCAIDAVQFAIERGWIDGWDVVIRGGGTLHRQIAERLDVPRTRDRVDVGVAYDLSDEYRAAAVFLQLSPGENVPSQSLLQAMVNECAVVATDVGNTRAWLNDNNSVLVPPESPQEVAEALLDLAEDAEKRRNLGRAARETVLEFPGWQEYCKYYLRIWNEVSRTHQDAARPSTS